MPATQNPREEILARRLRALGLNERQVAAGVEGRRQQIADSWRCVGR
jgi:hypothetical protein